MARLSLSFLGPFQVTLDGQPVTDWPSAKVRALLAYLAVESGRPHTREGLAEMLWPGYPERSDHTGLSNVLSHLCTVVHDRELARAFYTEWQRLWSTMSLDRICSSYSVYLPAAMRNHTRP